MGNHRMRIKEQHFNKVASDEKHGITDRKIIIGTKACPGECENSTPLFSLPPFLPSPLFVNSS